MLGREAQVVFYVLFEFRLLYVIHLLKAKGQELWKLRALLVFNFRSEERGCSEHVSQMLKTELWLVDLPLETESEGGDEYFNRHALTEAYFDDA